MKIKTWVPTMSDKETAALACWERNVLALRYADGWYNDDVSATSFVPGSVIEQTIAGPRYPGWRRVLSLDGGKITFHIPDDFDVGTLPMIEPNWDGHTTQEKWQRVLSARGVELESDAEGGGG
jgi:hypothetical protein